MAGFLEMHGATYFLDDCGVYRHDSLMCAQCATAANGYDGPRHPDKYAVMLTSPAARFAGLGGKPILCVVDDFGNLVRVQ